MKQLKDKIHLYNSYISYYVLEGNFKLIYIFAIVVAVYGGLLSRDSMSFFDGFLNSYSFNLFIISYFTINILSTIMFISFFNKIALFYEVRISNKISILKEKICLSVLFNLYFNILFIIINFSIIYLFNGHKFDSISYYGDINNFIYFIYCVFRIVLINILLCIYNVIIYDKFKFKVVFFDFLILFSIFLNPRRIINKYSVSIFDFISFSSFTSFSYDIISFILIFSLLFGLAAILVRCTKKFKINIMMLLSDIKYITVKKVNVLALYLIVHLLMFFIYKNIRSDYGFFFGLDFKFSNFNIISFSTFAFSEVTYIFILIKLLEKDMEYMYSVIFSRLNISKWFLSKISSFLIIVFNLKVIDYIMFYLIFKVPLSLVFRYFYVEILNILLIEIAIIIISLLKKKKYLYFMLFILMIILLPKNIISLYDYRYIIISIFVVFNCIMYLISRFRNNTIFSLIGGSYDRNKKYC